MFTLKQEVLASQCDSQANLSYLGTFQIIEDTLTAFMRSKKLDGITLSKIYGATWVFTKNKIEFRKTAYWGDKITIKCFCSSLTLATINITTVIYNQKNEIVCVSTVQMCALNLKEKKIFKLSQIKKLKQQKSKISQLQLEKLADCEGEKIDELNVKFTSIDNLYHTNNIEYIRFILNTYSVKELLSKPIKTIQIDYVNQTYENDILSVNKFNNKQIEQFSIKKDKQIAVLCKIER